MTKHFFLSILEDYATHWTQEDALRELLQNVIDGAIQSTEGSIVPNKTQHGYMINYGQKTVARIEYSNKEKDVLRLINYDTVLTKSVLLMGATSKANLKNQCGKFGEGMKFL